MMYEEIKDENNQILCIKRTDENGLISMIPISLANSDYQAYLKWLEEKPSGTIS